MWIIGSTSPGSSTWELRDVSSSASAANERLSELRERAQAGDGTAWLIVPRDHPVVDRVVRLNRPGIVGGSNV
jgi:hypothetical protein